MIEKIGIFGDKRDYHAIAFYSPKIGSIKEIRELLPEDFISEGNIFTSSEDILVEHNFYYSNQEFTTSSDLEKSKTKVGLRTMFEYDMYLLGYAAPKKFIGIVAVPFLKMAKVVFSEIHNNARGYGLMYQAINLEALIEEIKKGGGNIFISKIEWLVYGDPNANIVTLGGHDIIHSKLYTKNLSNTPSGIVFKPRKCQIIHDDPEGKSSKIETDNFGNFYFYIRSKAINLPWLSSVFSYFYTKKLVIQTTAQPKIQIREEINEGQ